MPHFASSLIDLSGVPGFSGFLNLSAKQTLRELISHLHETYCGSIGYEYTHIVDEEKCNWLRARIEKLTPDTYSKEKKLQLFDRCVCLLRPEAVHDLLADFVLLMLLKIF